MFFLCYSTSLYLIWTLIDLWITKASPLIGCSISLQSSLDLSLSNSISSYYFTTITLLFGHYEVSVQYVKNTNIKIIISLSFCFTFLLSGQILPWWLKWFNLLSIVFEFDKASLLFYNSTFNLKRTQITFLACTTLSFQLSLYFGSHVHHIL